MSTLPNKMESEALQATEKAKLHHSEFIQRVCPIFVVIVPKQAFFVCFNVHITGYKVKHHANEENAIDKFPW